MTFDKQSNASRTAVESKSNCSCNHCIEFYCGCLFISFLLDQRRLIIWKKMITSNNALLTRVLAKLSQPRIVAIVLQYGIIQLQSCSVNCIKSHVLSTFF